MQKKRKNKFGLSKKMIYLCTATSKSISRIADMAQLVEQRIRNA